MNIYDFRLPTPQRGELPLSDFEGKVLLIVNTATGCGFTPQYEPLESLYNKYKDKGLVILDIPCNQFGNQTPGSDEEIHEFCSLNYHTSFPRMKKSDVNGPNALPLYGYLKSKKGFEGFGEGKMADLLRSFLPTIAPDYEKTPDIKWNFTKFLVDRQGNVIARYEPTADMANVEKDILACL
ncbi:MAG: glutathione peroxidase [Bacilli bacterium]|nr:glutathione peroxidase [Bacilli bacterium]